MKKYNNFYRIHFKRDLFVLLLVLVTPFLFFFYDITPSDVKIWKTRWFIIDALDFEKVDKLFWHYSVKLLTIFIVSIWLVTCKHRWRYAILIPILVEGYKFGGLVNQTFSLFEDYNFLHSLPFSLSYILVLFFISKKLGYYSKTKSLSSELNIEISELMAKVSKINKKDYKIIKKQLIDLRNKKESMDKKEYLAELIALQDSIVMD